MNLKSSKITIQLAKIPLQINQEKIKTHLRAQTVHFPQTILAVKTYLFLDSKLLQGSKRENFRSKTCKDREDLQTYHLSNKYLNSSNHLLPCLESQEQALVSRDHTEHTNLAKLKTAVTVSQTSSNIILVE